MATAIENLLWVEKHRPRRIADCCLPARLRKIFDAILKTGTVGNMTLAGPAGTGKTTVAAALGRELGMDVLMINASENGNIDMIRTTVRQFGSGMSFSGKQRLVILDEGDYLTPLAQASLRGMMEELSANCRFILTANFGNKLIGPLLSRCPVVDFTYTSEEKIEAIIEADMRVRNILAEEGVVLTPEAEEPFSDFFFRHFPDMRTLLNILQRSCNSGDIDWRALTTSTNLHDYEGLVTAMKSSNFSDIRQWVAENVDRDGPGIRRQIFSSLETIVVPQSMPGIILILAEYDYKEAFVVDKEINTLAMLLSIVAEAQFQ